MLLVNKKEYDDKMENHRLLYLVQHSNNEMFKIGIGTNNHRFQDLDRDYSIDWESSLYFQGENHDITKMERILHKLFHEYRLDKQNGTGGTELFSTDCLNSVVESILFNVDNSGVRCLGCLQLGNIINEKYPFTCLLCS